MSNDADPIQVLCDRAETERLVRERVESANNRVKEAHLKFDQAHKAVHGHDMPVADGVYSLQRASAELRAAHEQFRQALRELTDRVIRGILPPSNEDKES